jgi:DNA-binding CsgD family transcriptional regulator
MTITHRGLPGSQLTAFVGREAELRELSALVASRRLVTLTGEAGVGKSRTAGRVAEVLRRSLGGSTALVPLAGVAPDEIPHAIAEVMGASGSSIVDIVRALGERPHLLILDALEDAPAARSLLTQILESTTEARVLVTSRMRTGMTGETPYPLRPLVVPGTPTSPRGFAAVTEAAGCALLLQRIREEDPGFDIATVSVEDLVAVCRATDGLPRFIEAAARAVCVLGMNETAMVLGEDPTVLDDFLPPKPGILPSAVTLERGLADVSDSSVELVRRLALFESAVDVTFVAEVFAEGSLARLAAPTAQLVEHSLIRAESVGGRKRVSVPFLYRHHLRARVTEDDRAHWQGMIRAVLLQHLRACATSWFSDDQLSRIQFLNRHAAEITTVLGAMAADPRTAHETLDVVSSLRYYWQLHPVDPWPRARDWIDTALACDGVRDVVTLRALLTDAYIAFHEGDVAGARAQLTVIASDSELAPTEFGERMLAAFIEALVLLAEGAIVTAATQLADVLAQSLSAGIREHIGEKYWYLAACHIAAGEYDRALSTLDDGLAYCGQIGDVWGRAYMWCLLALVRERQGEHDGAIEYVRDAAVVMSDFGDRVGLALCLQLLAGFSARHGEPAPPPLEPLGQGTTLARPPVPLPEFARADGDSASTPGHLPDDSALGEMLARLIDGDPAPLQVVRPDASSVLSAREWEIADLIAEGLGNPAIAARLVLSRRTVEGHVQRILAKLGFRSRSQIAVWSAQQRAATTPANG